MNFNIHVKTFFVLLRTPDRLNYLSIVGSALNSLNNIGTNHLIVNLFKHGTNLLNPLT